MGMLSLFFQKNDSRVRENSEVVVIYPDNLIIRCYEPMKTIDISPIHNRYWTYWKIPLKNIDDLGVPLFQETCIIWTIQFAATIPEATGLIPRPCRDHGRAVWGTGWSRTSVPPMVRTQFLMVRSFRSWTGNLSLKHWGSKFWPSWKLPAISSSKSQRHWKPLAVTAVPRAVLWIDWDSIDLIIYSTKKLPKVLSLYYYTGCAI